MAIVNEEDIVSEKSTFIDKQCDTLQTNRESKMAKQNVYDNEGFFENFKDTRSKKINFNDCIETPILLSLLPEVRGKLYWILVAAWDSTQSNIPIWGLNL